jgi:hypothetical protein
MNYIAHSRTKLESLISTQYLLAAVLSANTMALIALDRLGAFPDWIKTAAALLLAF